MCEACGCQNSSAGGSEAGEVQTVEVHQSLLAANEKAARANREHIESMGAVAINMISGPGSGKTTLLERTIEIMANESRIGVIEGDIETERDAERIRAKGVPVVQLTTGGACHLDAPLVHKGLHRLEEAAGSQFDLIFIENVGNLVCPATFALGEHCRVVLISVPEGSDKPAKYPSVFQSSQALVITKTDLISYFNFSMEEATREALSINPGLQIIALSSTSEDVFRKQAYRRGPLSRFREESGKVKEGLDEWLSFLRSLLLISRREVL
ncbi:MAG: hydrogenase nickel incorporation protein HypB [Thermodesulfobacteriota bacterium]